MSYRFKKVNDYPVLNNTYQLNIRTLRISEFPNTLSFSLRGNMTRSNPNS